MRLATPGGLVTVSKRAWPLANLNGGGRRVSNGNTLLQMVDTLGGGERFVDYRAVYRANPWVYAAVQARARGVARLALKVYKFDANGDRERVRGDLPGSVGRNSAAQELDRVLRYPEPRTALATWARKIVTDHGIYGNALATIDRNPVTGGVNYLYHAPWRRVTVEEGDAAPILWYEVQGASASRLFSPEDVVHFGRGSDPDSPIGISPLAPLSATLALHDALMRHAVAYMTNSARPSGMIKLDRASSEGVIKTVREQVRDLYASPENAGQIIVGSGDFVRFDDAMDQSGLIELAKQSREEISAAYAIPQPILGILDRAILNNTKELRSFWFRDIVGPLADELEGDLMAQLIDPTPALRGNFAEFDLDEVLRPDLEARATVYEQLRHVYTPQEMRRMENLSPLTGKAGKEAETVWMPAGQQGLGIEPTPPAAPPASDTSV